MLKRGWFISLSVLGGTWPPSQFEEWDGESLKVRDMRGLAGGGGWGWLCIRDILIPSLGMGRFLLYDRHGIFVQFSCRKITWSGVICITELDQHYLPPSYPSLAISPLDKPKQTVCTALAAPSPSISCSYKTTNYQINIHNRPWTPFTALGKDTLKLARETSAKEKIFYGRKWLCVSDTFCLCVFMRVCPGDLFLKTFKELPCVSSSWGPL